MATIGQPLTSPEAGWKRIQETDVNITFEGGGWSSFANVAYSGGSRIQCVNSTVTPKIKFNFTGKKLILLSSMYTTYSSNIEVKIDGKVVGNYSQALNSNNQAVFFVIDSLGDTEHFVEITKLSAGTFDVDFTFDAVDIDVNGLLKPYYIPKVNKILLSSGNGKIKAITNKTLTSNLIPIMTSNVSPIATLSASSEYVSWSSFAYKAFNGITTGNDGWVTQEVQYGWLASEFVKPIIVGSYTVFGYNYSTYSNMNAKNWTFEGSNDGVNWTVLDTQIGIDVAKWTALGYCFIANLKNTTPYKIYRINVTENNGGAQLRITEMQMFERLVNIRSIPSQSEQNFINHGMSKSDLASTDMYADYAEKHYIQDATTVLGSGKVFEHVLDVNKVLKKIKIK